MRKSFKRRTTQCYCCRISFEASNSTISFACTAVRIATKCKYTTKEDKTMKIELPPEPPLLRLQPFFYFVQLYNEPNEQKKQKKSIFRRLATFVCSTAKQSCTNYHDYCYLFFMSLSFFRRFFSLSFFLLLRDSVYFFDRFLVIKS